MITSLNPKKNQPKAHFEDPFQSALKDPDDFKTAMSPSEVSEIVSDRVISIVRKQFEEARKTFLEKNKKS